jgi:hypothetical protein
MVGDLLTRDHVLSDFPDLRLVDDCEEMHVGLVSNVKIGI